MDTRDNGTELHVGKLFAMVRKEAGHSQTQAAKRLGITQSRLSQIESGLNTPGGEVLAKMRRVYGFPSHAFHPPSVEEVA